MSHDVHMNEWQWTHSVLERVQRRTLKWTSNFQGNPFEERHEVCGMSLLGIGQNWRTDSFEMTTVSWS